MWVRPGVYRESTDFAASPRLVCNIHWDAAPRRSARQSVPE